MICHDKISNQTRLKCGHVYCYLCIKTHLTLVNRVCPVCRCHVKHEELNCEKLDVPIGKHVWMYSGKNYGWWMYDRRANHELEDFYRQFRSGSGHQYEINLSGLNIEVDFKQMTQRGLGTGVTRSIIRIDRSNESDYHINGLSGIPYKSSHIPARGFSKSRRLSDEHFTRDGMGPDGMGSDDIGPA